MIAPGRAELRQMRHKADSDKKEAALADRTMHSIEEQAKKQYEKDLADAQAAASSIGDWVRLQSGMHVHKHCPLLC